MNGGMRDVKSRFLVRAGQTFRRSRRNSSQANDGAGVDDEAALLISFRTCGVTRIGRNCVSTVIERYRCITNRYGSVILVSKLRVNGFVGPCQVRHITQVVD
jgi:hypothetical protein